MSRIVIEETKDRAKLVDMYGNDRVRNSYQIGSLADEYFDLTHCYWVATEDGPRASTTLYEGLTVPALFTWGEVSYLDLMLHRLFHLLPDRVLLHAYPDHAAAVSGKLKIQSRRRMVRMKMTPDKFRPVASKVDIEQLNHSDTGAIISLYSDYPDRFFEPYQVETGFYFGVREQGKLVSVAGIHHMRRDIRFAMLGNVVTDPRLRGRGYAKAATSHLCAALFEFADLLVLDVPVQTPGAEGLFSELGFESQFQYDQAVASKTSKSTLTCYKGDDEVVADKRSR